MSSHAIAATTIDKVLQNTEKEDDQMAIRLLMIGVILVMFYIGFLVWSESSSREGYCAGNAIRGWKYF